LADFDDVPLQKRSLLTTSPIRVLVADDFEPFRAFVCSALRQKPGLELIGELSDGLAAVQKAEELSPDLILLDIGLPTLNGIEAARQIRKLVPSAKIIFLSQESSDDVVQEAIGLGAEGYVVKAVAGSELLPAVEAVLQGQQFVSAGVIGRGPGVPVRRSHSPELQLSHSLVDSQQSEIARRHEVLFYRDDASFVEIFTGFVAAALESGNAVLVVATESHLDGLRRAVETRGVDVATGIEKGVYVPINVVDMLSAFMVDGFPDRGRLLKVAAELIGKASKAVNGELHRVTACGECAPTLLMEWSVDAALRVEQLWDEVARIYGIEIFCGYALTSFQGDRRVFQKICAEHSTVYQDQGAT
jgi:DNA-binding NarL/FixJ family response regulator